MATKPYILLVAGHRSYGDRGSPVERALTDDLAVAYHAAFTNAGYPVEWFQQIDGDSDPTMTSGGLDAVALGCGRVLARRNDELSIMLDLHFNTTRSAVHVIVPHNLRKDGRGQLGSFYVQGRVAEDIIPNNPLDVAMAASIAAEIADIPGMTLWRPRGDGVSKTPGVMAECETGVGLNGSRLAMMGATAPYRMKAVRVVIEHGGTDDASKPNFFTNCATASLRAINRVMAARTAGGDGTGGGQPTEPEHPETPAVPSLYTWLFGEANGYTYDPSPAGLVSRLWVEIGNETGKWPRLIDTLETPAGRWFVFVGGLVIFDPAGPERPRVATPADIAA